MKDLIIKLFDYARYPSTWLGFIALLGVVGVKIAPEVATEIAQGCAALAGVILVKFSDADVKKPE